MKYFPQMLKVHFFVQHWTQHNCMWVSTMCLYQTIHPWASTHQSRTINEYVVRKQKQWSVCINCGKSHTVSFYSNNKQTHPYWSLAEPLSDFSGYNRVCFEMNMPWNDLHSYINKQFVFIILFFNIQQFNTRIDPQKRQGLTRELFVKGLHVAVAGWGQCQAVHWELPEPS